jgi:hypothetical protein
MIADLIIAYSSKQLPQQEKSDADVLEHWLDVTT